MVSAREARSATLLLGLHSHRDSARDWWAVGEPSSLGIRPACEQAMRDQESLVLEQHLDALGGWFEVRLQPSRPIW